MPKTLHISDPFLIVVLIQITSLQFSKTNKNYGLGEYYGKKFEKIIFLDHALLQPLLFFEMVLKANKTFWTPVYSMPSPAQAFLQGCLQQTVPCRGFPAGLSTACWPLPRLSSRAVYSRLAPPQAVLQGCLQ